MVSSTGNTFVVERNLYMKTILLLLTLQAATTLIGLTAQETYPVLASLSTDTRGKTGRIPPVYEYPLVAYAYELSQTTTGDNSQGDFGKSIDRKLSLLEKLYVTEKPLVPGNPQTRTMIRKPGIYLAVKKTERFLVRQVKREEIHPEEAMQLMDQVLTVALSLFSAETEAVETALASTRTDQERLDFFRNRIRLI